MLHAAHCRLRRIEHGLRVGVKKLAQLASKAVPRVFSRRVRRRLRRDLGWHNKSAALLRLPACTTATNRRMSFKSTLFIVLFLQL